MLGLYRKQFNDILSVKTKKRKTVLLSNLMSQMESYYKLSMVKGIFENETPAAVKELYLEVSAARVF